MGRSAKEHKLGRIREFLSSLFARRERPDANGTLPAKDTEFPWRAVMIDGVAYAVLSLSAFGLFATVTENYVFSEVGANPLFFNLNLGNAVAFNNAVNAIWRLNQAIFYPLFPKWLFVVLPDQDPYALVFFSLTLLSFGVIGRRLGVKAVLMRCLLAGSCILLVYEVGLTLVSPGYLDMHVTNAQVEYGFAWFTNLELLEVSSALVVVMLLARRRLGRGIPTRSPDVA